MGRKICVFLIHVQFKNRQNYRILEVKIMNTVKREEEAVIEQGQKKIISIENILYPHLGCCYMSYLCDNFLRYSHGHMCIFTSMNYIRKIN